MASPILLDSMRLCLVAFGCIAAYSGHLLLEPAGHAGPRGAQPLVAQGLGMVSLVTAGLAAVLAMRLPVILAG